MKMHSNGSGASLVTVTIVDAGPPLKGGTAVVRGKGKMSNQEQDISEGVAMRTRRNGGVADEQAGAAQSKPARVRGTRAKASAATAVVPVPVDVALSAEELQGGDGWSNAAIAQIHAGPVSGRAKSDAGAPKVQGQRKGALLARSLRNRIIRGELEEGAQLPPESKLMIEYGVSRPTLREGLRILESEGLVTVQRGATGRPTVNRPRQDVVALHFGLMLQSENTTLLDVFRARLMIEPPAVGLIAEMRREEAVAVLQEILDQQWEAFVDRDMLKMSHLTSRFHSALVELSGNKTLILMMHILNDIFEKHMKSITVTAGSDFNQVAQTKLGLKAERKLIELIRAGDVASVRPFWRMHMEEVEKVLFRGSDKSLLIDILD